MEVSYSGKRRPLLFRGYLSIYNSFKSGKLYILSVLHRGKKKTNPKPRWIIARWFGRVVDFGFMQIARSKLTYRVDQQMVWSLRSFGKSKHIKERLPPKWMELKTAFSYAQLHPNRDGKSIVGVFVSIVFAMGFTCVDWQPRVQPFCEKIHHPFGTHVN